MKNKQSAKRDKTPVTDAAKELRELMEQKPCYTPFSLEAIIDAGTPKKPSMQLPTSDLVARLRANAQELLNRAFAGEPDAVEEFCWFAHNLIRQLTCLSEKQQKEISEIASSYEDWPILYAPDDDSQAIYEKLGVGTKSFVQRYAGRKIDRRDNPWTHTALLMLELLRWCKQRLPDLIRSNQTCRKMSPISLSVGRTKIWIFYYDTPNAIFEVPEWCELCPCLPNQLRPENVNQFWKVARLAMLEYWGRSEFFGMSPSPYHRALNRVGTRKGRSDKSSQRGDALDAIKRAMVSLAGGNKT